jgi:tetratricopeptide (TPR) repeat protein
LNIEKFAFATVTILSISICQTPGRAENMSASDFIRESHEADLFIGERHWNIAQRILLRLVATHHGREHEYSQLSYCYLNALPGEEDFHAAELCARKAISLNPESGYAHAALAEARLGVNDYAGAIAAATKAVECKTPAEFVIYQRARAYSALNKYNEALKDFERYDRFIAKSNKTLVNLEAEGGLLEKMGRSDEAIKKYTADKIYHLEQATKNIVYCLQKQKKYP